MTTRELDQFILSAVSAHWQKVAMIIAKALTDPGLAIPDAGDGAETVAGRIATLIANGELEVHGNPDNWRHSEVRRVDPTVGAA